MHQKPKPKPKQKLIKKSSSLKSGRPPLSLSSSSLLSPHDSVKSVIPSTAKLPSKATRTIIRAHHNLHKARAKAFSEGNHPLVTSLDAEIERLGGLEVYQAASLNGQSKERGGDSSILLVRWLGELGLVGKEASKVRLSHRDVNEEISEGLRVLEIGALSSQNAISKQIGQGLQSVRRIDLKSQEPGIIEEIDFMKLNVPEKNEDRYEILSLSLVLNYVPDPKGRGEMLRRTKSFLKRSTIIQNPDSMSPSTSTTGQTFMSCLLFLVLPLPCVTNSRYMSTLHLQSIMQSLGYESIKIHQSAKLHYELYHHKDQATETRQSFKKIEINPGKVRNNFCIILDGT